MQPHGARRLGLAALLAALFAHAAEGGQPARPAVSDAISREAAASLAGDAPKAFTPVTDGFAYERREAMIPMRDGVRLHTVILVPRGAARAGIVLSRTPYNADEMTHHGSSAHLGPTLIDDFDAPADVIRRGGYIRVVQDVRGKYGSEGAFVMNRPLAGTVLNPGRVDDATDAYDTIDWLTHHVPESNGRVAIMGISYDGFTSLMATIHPHPALKAAIPMNPMVDGWVGDDWFHNGAFQQQNLPYIYEQDGTRANTEKWWTDVHDDFDLYLRAGSAGALARSHGLEQAGFWRRVQAHPAYDAFWSGQAMDRVLGAQPLAVPMLLVHGDWDAEDIYGDLAVYRALKPKDATGDRLHLVLGPWNHGQQVGEATHVGAISWGQDTGRWFRRQVLAPYLAHYLGDDAAPLALSPVVSFESGTNAWRDLPAWPVGPDGAPPTPTRLYLQPGLKLGYLPAPGPARTLDYVSDPAKPTPYRARPIQPMGYDTGQTFSDWLADDQREASGRPDVLAFSSEVLTAPVHIAGQPVAHLTASTSGTDSDWVVKLIDVYPDENSTDTKLGGWQLNVGLEIFRGRYRESASTPQPLRPNAPLAYRIVLPAADHVFLPGHRIMVQVQSSLFPLYDRNPQTFVPSIFVARPVDYVKALQRVTVSGPAESFVELPVVQSPSLASVVQ